MYIIDYTRNRSVSFTENPQKDTYMVADDSSFAKKTTTNIGKLTRTLLIT